MGDAPFAGLSVIAGPALLINASSLLLLSATTRYGRALDRARLLAARIAEAAAVDDAERSLLRRQLETAQKRVLLMIRVLTVFYTAVGAFGLGTLCSVVGISLLGRFATAQTAFVLVALVATAIGVLCVIIGTGTMVWESRLSYAILRAEAAFVLGRAAKPDSPQA